MTPAIEKADEFTGKLRDWLNSQNPDIAVAVFGMAEMIGVETGLWSFDEKDIEARVKVITETIRETAREVLRMADDIDQRGPRH